MRVKSIQRRSADAKSAPASTPGGVEAVPHTRDVRYIQIVPYSCEDTYALPPNTPERRPLAGQGGVAAGAPRHQSSPAQSAETSGVAPRGRRRLRAPLPDSVRVESIQRRRAVAKSAPASTPGGVEAVTHTRDVRYIQIVPYSCEDTYALPPNTPERRPLAGQGGVAAGAPRHQSSPAQSAETSGVAPRGRRRLRAPLPDGPPAQAWMVTTREREDRRGGEQ